MKNLLNYKRLSRVAIPVALVGAVAASLWFASPLPVKALTIDFTSLPPSGTLGDTYTFEVKVSVQNVDLLPVQSINLEIRNTAAPSTYAAICTGLPIPSVGLTTATKSYTHAQTGGGDFTVTASTASGWGYAQGNRYGYGYRDPEGWGQHDFGVSWGYGYGYGTYIGATSITYTVTWTPPSTWPEGTYNIKTLVYGDGTKKFSGTSTSFTLSSGVYYAGGAPAPSAIINSQGVFTQTVTIPSSDGKVQVTVDSGTTGKTKEGNPLSQIISVSPMAAPPAPPADSNVIGLTYDLRPEGATFDPPITITLNYDPTKIPAGVNEKDLVLAFYDKTTGEWVVLEDATVDPTTHTISGKASHFTAFAVIAYTRPAAFTTSALSISPPEVNMGESITISTLVTNTGDLTGSYNVALKIDNVTEATKDVTLAGHASQRVTFLTAKDVAGTYTVSIDGQSGTFTVKTPPAPAAFTTRELTISPTEANIWESITIRVLVTNTGDLTGSYNVALKINNVTVETKDVALAGHASQTVTFLTTKDVAGTYTVSIDGQSGTFTVKTPPAVPAKVNWPLIIGYIIAGVIVITLIVWLVIRRRAY